MLAFLLALLLSFGSLARAESPIPDPVVSLRVTRASVGESVNRLDVELAAEIAEGWHINSTSPTDDVLVPTTLEIVPPAGWEVGAITPPPAEPLALAFAPGRTLAVYGGTVHFAIALMAGERSADVPDRTPVEFLARLRYQACDETRCLRPSTVERSFVVETIAGGRAAAAVDNVAPVERWLAERGLVWTLLLVALLGLGLNLTPCVYPLISVTLAYFGRQSREASGPVLVLAIAYALGIATTFSVLGVAAALGGRLFGAALGHPAVILSLSGLMIALALSCFGLYRFQPPAALLQAVGGSSAGIAGAIFMGLTMGVVAAPCVGPIVVGLLAAVAARGDPFFGFLLFFTLAIGLGSPYVVLAATAGRLARLPRSGDWLVWIEHVFGVALLALAAYFSSPLLPDDAFRLGVPIFAAASGIYLGFLDPSGKRLPYFSVAKRAFGAALVAGALWAVFPAVEGPQIPWRSFSKMELDRARVEGRPAVLDFRADWCLPCVEMEHSTFVAPQVVSRSESFVMLSADVTQMSPANENLLTEYSVLGVPTTIFFDRTGREHQRRVGFVAADEFAELLQETSRANPPAELSRSSD